MQEMFSNTRQRVESIFRKHGSLRGSHAAGLGGGPEEPSTPRRQPDPREEEQKIERLQSLLADDLADLTVLREVAWTGLPKALRPACWMLLTGYMPCNRQRRADALLRKRSEYHEYVRGYYYAGNGGASASGGGGSGGGAGGAGAGKGPGAHSLSEQHCTTLGATTAADLASRMGVSVDDIAIRRQLSKDLPRMGNAAPILHTKELQGTLERILYVWSIRHPATGYVQGINSLAIPFLLVFLSEYMDVAGKVEEDEAKLQLLRSAEEGSPLYRAEADTYWCVSALLDVIQDHYTPDQPGLQKSLSHLQKVVGKVEPELYAYLTGNQIDFLQFAYAWIHCLLMRELGGELGPRLLDTYLAESANFPSLHVYVCAAVLRHFSRRLHGAADSADLEMMLTNLPLQEMAPAELQEIVAQAWLWREQYHQSSHLT